MAPAQQCLVLGVIQAHTEPSVTCHAFLALKGHSAPLQDSQLVLTVRLGLTLTG